MPVQIPGPGMPIDAKLLSNWATELNRISGTLSNSSKRSTVRSPGASGISRELMTSELGFFGTYVDISKTNVAINSSDDFSVDISGFSLTPVAVATPVNQDSATQIPEVLVILTSVTSSRVNGKIIYKSSGTVNIRINVLVMGVPSGVT